LVAAGNFFVGALAYMIALERKYLIGSCFSFATVLHHISPVRFHYFGNGGSIGTRAANAQFFEFFNQSGLRVAGGRAGEALGGYHIVEIE
jgi:hypothetical protein